MRFFSTDEINNLLTYRVLVDAIADGHRRAPIRVADTMMTSSGSDYFIRNAVDEGRFVGTKMVTSNPANLNGGELPAVQAVGVLFDGSNGRPLAVFDGTILTQWRTACDSALGSQLLSKPDAEGLLVIGAGAMARPLAKAHMTVRPSLGTVTVWNRTRARAEEVVADLQAEGLNARVADDLDAAIASSGVITACTRAHEPIIAGQLLKPGTHVDLVGAYTPTMSEADDDVMRNAVFVDRRETAIDVGEIAVSVARGFMTEHDVRGDLHDLVSGRAGRANADQITVFKNGGGGHLDLITMETILKAAGE